MQLLGQWAIEGKVEAIASKDGAFEIELTSIVERWLRDGLPNELLLTAVHPLCLISESRVGFETAELDASDPNLSTHLFRCEVTLTTGAVVTGRVIVPPDWTLRAEERSGNPPRLKVSLFELGADSHRTRRPFELTECDAQGRFALHANHTGTFDIIATTLGLEPESKSVDLILGKSIELAPITLTRGSSISGTVLRNGRPIGAGIEVYAELKGMRNWDSVQLLSGGFEELGQRDGEIRRTRPQAFTDADGRYSLDGLAPAEYELRVVSLPKTQVGLGSVRRVERTVLAPHENVDLRLLPPLIRFSCTIDGLATSDRERLVGERLSIVPLAPDGRALEVEASDVDLWGCQGNITVNPAVPYEFRLAAGRFEPTLVFVPALTLSEERDVKMDLKPRTGTCTLVVRFALNPGDEIDEPQFAFVDPQAAADAEPKWRTVPRGKDGAYVLGNLLAGQFVVQVQPYGPYYRSISKAPYLGAEFSIELLVGKTAQYQLKLELGSRVRLCAKDERGGYVRAAIELRNAGGDKLQTEFYCTTPTGGYGCGWYLCEQGINDHPPLPAGHYELKLTADGFEDATASFDLIQGETTTLEIPMRHR
ncbi:MAG TPA: carboxypeptidase-like regulatory domain-containing protein [Planctomycetota bacterium]|nr:carboxypeptidase-like regulatory domain-containing protein [Planctomycetota bacterium]